MVPFDLVEVAAFVAVEAAVAMGAMPGHHEVFAVPCSVRVNFPSVVAEVFVLAVFALNADSV